ncbi:hypothetical protein [Myxosarcina sp. GI1(2024)]
MSSPESPSAPDSQLETVLLEVERSLSELNERHAQVKRDTARRSQLIEQQQSLKQQQQPLKTELRQIQQELEELEFKLESCLLPDLFWQVVRFVFLGVLIGWLLRSVY